MTVPYIKMDPSGTYVAQAGRDWTLPEGAIAPPDWMDIEDARDWMLTAGEWSLRPTSPVPPVTSMVAYSTTITGCPAGTYAEISDIEGGEFMGTVTEAGGDIAISLPDPGTYRIEVFAPLPYLPSFTTVISE